ncbi:MAG TPA: glycoside hydrolase family 88 protein [Opitutus sp.]|nr:glycoside hydrolase family 88 protein [Opitutus sp.]
MLGTVVAAAATTPEKVDLSGRTEESIREVVRRVARHHLRSLGDGEYPAEATIDVLRTARPPTGVQWTYPWGVTLYGMLRSTDATGDVEVREFVREHNRIIARYFAWLEGVREKVGGTPEWDAFIRDDARTPLRRLLLLGNLDFCGAMGVEMLEDQLRHPEAKTPEQHAVVARVADWIGSRQFRLPDGTVWRPDRTDVKEVMPRGTLWIDDLYMACPFLVRWGQSTGDDRHLRDAARNVINMAARMQDRDGVWFHAYFENAAKASPWKWGRANGWAMVATVEILSAMPDEHPDRPALLEILRKHIDGLKPLQAESGLWRQVLDRSELWEETSCTAMFSYCIARAVNRGWIDRSYLELARRGFAGVAGNVTPEGVVKGTCQGTNIGLDLDYYVNRLRPDDDLHGPGVVLLAGTEILAAGR